jgi:hypothetical protein
VEVATLDIAIIVLLLIISAVGIAARFSRLPYPKGAIDRSTAQRLAGAIDAQLIAKQRDGAGAPGRAAVPADAKTTAA